LLVKLAQARPPVRASSHLRPLTHTQPAASPLYLWSSVCCVRWSSWHPLLGCVLCVQVVAILPAFIESMRAMYSKTEPSKVLPASPASAVSSGPRVYGIGGCSS
jgi:hypothetical protein